MDQATKQQLQTLRSHWLVTLPPDDEASRIIEHQYLQGIMRQKNSSESPLPPAQ